MCVRTDCVLEIALAHTNLQYSPDVHQEIRPVPPPPRHQPRQQRGVQLGDRAAVHKFTPRMHESPATIRVFVIHSWTATSPATSRGSNRSRRPAEVGVLRPKDLSQFKHRHHRAPETLRWVCGSGIRTNSFSRKYADLKVEPVDCTWYSAPIIGSLVFADTTVRGEVGPPVAVCRSWRTSLHRLKPQQTIADQQCPSDRLPLAPT